LRHNAAISARPRAIDRVRRTGRRANFAGTLSAMANLNPSRFGVSRPIVHLPTAGFRERQPPVRWDLTAPLSSCRCVDFEPIGCSRGPLVAAAPVHGASLRVRESRAVPVDIQSVRGADQMHFGNGG